MPAPSPSPLASFRAATRAWFDAAFAAATRVQRDGWPAIARGEDCLLVAPTGSGKTLAAFLFCLDRLLGRDEGGARGYRAVYVSPLKALVYDIEKNLRAPLAGIALTAARLGEPIAPVRVDVRTGDTSQEDRRRMARAPGDILITTPESLYLMLGSAAAAHFATVETIIVDEIHALAPTKRGAHLALSIERLSALAEARPQRIGLSATVRPPGEVGRFLTGGAPAHLIDASAPPRLDLGIVVPIEDMTRPELDLAARREQRGAALGLVDEAEVTARERRSVWPAIEPRILELVQAHRATIVFVNSRGLAERLAGRLNELAGEELVRAHHGSIAHAQRDVIEDALERGELRGIVATSSLELGIDMGAVDLVVQVESPDSVARGLQRVGRAGHGVGQVSRGRIFPKHRGDLLEAAVVCERMQRGEIESLRIPLNPLDVLAQQIVAICAVGPITVADLAALVRRALPYRGLSDDALGAVLDMLSGRYPSTDFADLRPRLDWDRETDLLTARKGAKLIALLNGGTIPDRGLYGVYIAPDGPRVGELDEEMVHESRAGETFLLGASSWKIAEITRDRVLVTPAPGEPGKMPFWHGDGPGRPLELGRAIGAFTREVGAMGPRQADAWLAARYPLDELARSNLLAYLAEQREVTGTLPTDQAITVERFRDELGEWRVCVLTPFGARVHAPWALVFEAVLSAEAGFDVQALWSDDGICLRFADADDPPGWEQLVVEPEDVEELLIERLASSSLFASRFRENAARALLLPRRRADGRAPLWQQRLRAANLLAVARQYPAFPIVLETYRACLKDVFDVDALRELLSAIRRRDVRVDEVETVAASPFARGLAFSYVAAFLYEGDAPLAERKAQALTLDRDLLQELLGQEELRALLDAGVIDAVEAELQGLAEDRRARDAADLHDLLRRVGALTLGAMTQRVTTEDAGPWVAELERTRRAVPLRIAGEARWAAAEDVALYRDALGTTLPSGLPAALLATRERPLEELAQRWARTHGPFSADALAAHLGLHPEPVRAVLAALATRGRLLEGAFRPGGRGREHCDPEVLRRIRRRTLAALRHAVEPVDASVLARFLLGWHGLATADGRPPRGGPERLLEVVAQLEGLPLPWRELERRILPARVPGYQPRMLDELGAIGAVVWVGAGPLGPGDGRVMLYRRERVATLLAEGGAYEAPTPLHAALLEVLATRGASFLTELGLRVGGPPVRELAAALWDLVWAGLATNDTFGPLRSLGASARKKAAAGSLRARPAGVGGVASLVSGGRWSPVADLRLGQPTDTERAHAVAASLLERYGVVSREAADAEGLPGGFSAVYPVLRAMEELGKVRRGYFVEGLSGSQFALAGVVDRLRAAREPRADPAVRLLPSVDPANPYGALLPWPAAPGGALRPRRAAETSVVLVDGRCALFAGPKGKRLTAFPAMEEAAVAVAAFGALRGLARERRTRLVQVEQVNGGPARGGPWQEALAAAGFRGDYRGMTLTPPVS